MLKYPQLSNIRKNYCFQVKIKNISYQLANSDFTYTASLKINHFKTQFCKNKQKNQSGIIYFDQSLTINKLICGRLEQQIVLGFYQNRKYGKKEIFGVVRLRYQDFLKDQKKIYALEKCEDLDASATLQLFVTNSETSYSLSKKSTKSLNSSSTLKQDSFCNVLSSTDKPNHLSDLKLVNKRVSSLTKIDHSLKQKYDDFKENYGTDKKQRKLNSGCGKLINTQKRQTNLFKRFKNKVSVTHQNNFLKIDRNHLNKPTDDEDLQGGGGDSKISIYFKSDSQFFTNKNLQDEPSSIKIQPQVVDIKINQKKSLKISQHFTSNLITINDNKCMKLRGYEGKHKDMKDRNQCLIKVNDLLFIEVKECKKKIEETEQKLKIAQNMLKTQIDQYEAKIKEIEASAQTRLISISQQSERIKQLQEQLNYFQKENSDLTLKGQEYKKQMKMLRYSLYEQQVETEKAYKVNSIMKQQQLKSFMSVADKISSMQNLQEVFNYKNIEKMKNQIDSKKSIRSVHNSVQKINLETVSEDTHQQNIEEQEIKNSSQQNITEKKIMDKKKRKSSFFKNVL